MRTGCTVTSHPDEDYNCIAWAAGDTEIWWWPIAGHKPNYWPDEAPRSLTVEAFINAFATRRYTPCDTPNLEPGFEKVALYVDSQNVPKHMARQLANGKWSSRLGEHLDIEHPTLDGLEGNIYGKAKVFMRRPVSMDSQ